LKVLNTSFIGADLNPHRCNFDDWSKLNLPLDIDPLFDEIFPVEYSRLGRFIKLVLLGAHHCIKEVDKDIFTGNKVGIFIASALGNSQDTNSFYQSLFSTTRGRFSPFKFANSVGNSAAFYLAKFLDINTEIYFISQEEQSFEAALYSAETALKFGQISYALVGGCDEYSAGWQSTVKKLNIDYEDYMFSEGSGWMLLKKTELHENPDISKISFTRIDHEKTTLKQALLPLINDLNRKIFIGKGMRTNEEDLNIIKSLLPNAEIYDYLRECGS